MFARAGDRHLQPEKKNETEFEGERGVGRVAWGVAWSVV